MGRIFSLLDNGLFMMEKILENPNFSLILYRNFIENEECVFYFKQLIDFLDFEQTEITLFGKKIVVPRLESFHSKNGKTYGYSGKRLKTKSFNPILQKLNVAIEKAVNHSFNSVLVNLYRNEKDSNGWHADDEKELGKNPTIASISLGQSRRFQIKHKIDKKTLTLNLNSGDLLLMTGSFQHEFKHQIPKEKKSCGPRLNLTFRFIY